MEKKKLLSKEIKEEIKNVKSRLCCTYEGCGADDGWPRVTTVEK